MEGLTMTDAEIQTEKAYRLSERIAILAEDRAPTPEQTAIATREADEWEAKWRDENPPE